MNTVLLTGGAGYIGSHISRELLKEDYNVIIVDDLSSGRKDFIPSGVEFFEGDFSDTRILEKINVENINLVTGYVAQDIYNIVSSEKEKKPKKDEDGIVRVELVGAPEEKPKEPSGNECNSDSFIAQPILPFEIAPADPTVYIEDKSIGLLIKELGNDLSSENS